LQIEDEQNFNREFGISSPDPDEVIIRENKKAILKDMGNSFNS
jgi:hypothetical protein